MVRNNIHQTPGHSKIVETMKGDDPCDDCSHWAGNLRRPDKKSTDKVSLIVKAFDAVNKHRS